MHGLEECEVCEKWPAVRHIFAANVSLMICEDCGRLFDSADFQLIQGIRFHRGLDDSGPDKVRRQKAALTRKEKHYASLKRVRCVKRADGSIEVYADRLL